MVATAYAISDTPKYSGIRGGIVTTASATVTGTLTDASIVSQDESDGIYVVFKLDSATATVVNVVSTGTGFGGTWKRAISAVVSGGATFEFWECKNYAKGVSGGKFSATLSASVTSSWVATVGVQNYGTIINRSVGTGTSTAPATVSFSISSSNMMGHALFWAASGAAISSNNAGLKQPPNWELDADPVFTSTGWSVMSSTVDLQGASSAVAISRRATVTPSALWYAVQLTVSTTTISLDDYTYQLGDYGVLLNDPADKTLPIYDVEKVTGLSDLPLVSDSSSLDGQDGGYANVSFLNVRTVVIEGTIYCVPSEADVILDELKRGLLPTRTSKPFHMKHPGTEHRMLWVKPVGFNCDIDQGRARGVMPFQIQLVAGDPRLYGDSQGVLIPRTGTAVVVNNTGIKETYPLIYFYMATADTAGTLRLSFRNESWPTNVMTDNVVEVTPNTTGKLLPKDDWYVWDMAKRTLVNSAGEDYSWAIDTTGAPGWWGLVSGSNRVSFDTTGTNTEAAYMVWAEAWA
jgi:hypothetical protein